MSHAVAPSLTDAKTLRCAWQASFPSSRGLNEEGVDLAQFLIGEAQLASDMTP
jgi:hypothetical protein